MPSDLLPLISTHSMLTTFKRCPRQAMYAYVDELKPIKGIRPLKMGEWFHTLLETHYKGDNWREKHEELIHTQEEKFFTDELKNVPDNCYRIMESYLWHYQLERKYGWTVKEVELKLETTWPDGYPYWCKLDLLVEINGELWIVDHKLRTSLPGQIQRLLDSQNLLYMWAAHKNGLKIAGFIWNYVRMRPPTIPQPLKNGELSKRKIITDFVTLKGAIQDHHITPSLYATELRELKSLFWRPNKPQLSPFFRRESLDRNPEAISRLVKEMYRTHKRMRSYDFGNRDFVERVLDQSCDWHCDYPILCASDLFGGNTSEVIRLHYKKADPLGYYSDIE